MVGIQAATTKFYLFLDDALGCFDRSSILLRASIDDYLFVFWVMVLSSFGLDPLRLDRPIVGLAQAESC